MRKTDPKTAMEHGEKDFSPLDVGMETHGSMLFFLGDFQFAESDPLGGHCHQPVKVWMVPTEVAMTCHTPQLRIEAGAGERMRLVTHCFAS